MTYFQKPNKSLIVTLIFLILSLVTKEEIHILSVVLAATAGTVWSYQEVLEGTNPFRKKLGIVGFICVAIYLIINFLLILLQR